MTSEVQVLSRYLDPFTDFGFKKLFGIESSKHFLIDFLNALLKPAKKIVDLELLPTEQLGLRIEDRKAVFDVYCIDETGRRFVLELQRISQQHFKDRSLYYSIFPIRAQARTGVWNYELKETVVICLLEFSFDDTHPDQLLHEVKLIERQSGRVFNDHITYWYIEASKFCIDERDLQTRLDQWLFVLTGLKKFIEIPVSLREDELFKLFFMTAETAQLMEEELMAYYASKKEEWDKYAIEQTAERRGEAKGREEERYAIAHSMKAKGLDNALISETTGLPLDEINSL